MPNLDAALQTLWLDLVERAHAAAMPPTGVVIRRERRGRIYLYRRVFEAATGKTRDRYLGADTPELQARIAEAEAAQAGGRDRARVVRALTASGLPYPARAVGRLLAALAEAGVFRLRAVLIGTHAYAVYGPLLGVRLPAALMATMDVDVAQAPDVSLAMDDALDDTLLDVLRRVDPGFQAMDSIDHSALSWRFQSPASGLRLDVLASRAGKGGRGGIVMLPALKSGGQVLDFMDCLLRETVPAVILSGPGIPVTVPRPGRYAIHKLIISSRRQDSEHSKAAKDLRQAEALIRILAAHHREELQDAWEEARERGDSWAAALNIALKQLPADVRDMLTGIA